MEARRRVLEEQKLGISGLVNRNSAKKIGELLGAEGILLGTVNDMGDTVTINARIVAVETGNTIRACEVELAKTPIIVELLKTPVHNNTDMGITLPPGTKKPIQVIKMNGFVFALQSCSNVSGSVSCNLLITNTKQDRDLHFSSYKSRIIDKAGNICLGDTMQLGNKEGREANVQMIRDVPIKAAISFKGVLPEIQTATVIELYFGSRGGKAQFRNVSLKQK